MNVLGADHIHRLGLSSDQLLPTNVELDCANAIGTSVMGLFFAKVSGISVTSGTDIPARTMVYVYSGHACLISRGTLLVIGCLPQQFPEIGWFLLKEETKDNVGEDMDGAQSREGAETINTASMATRRPQRAPSMTGDTKQTKEVAATVHSGNPGIKTFSKCTGHTWLQHSVNLLADLGAFINLLPAQPS